MAKLSRPSLMDVGHIRIHLYPCKAPCKTNSYETICENIISRYQTLVSSLPRETLFDTNDQNPIL